MNVHRELGNRKPIIPSARKGIHDRGSDGKDMEGRYGIDFSSDEELSDSADGVDEVDNVMSKYSHPSSPVSARRRNSLTPPHQQYIYDSVEHGAIAKSLPATLPSRSLYSGDFDICPHSSGISHLNKSDSLSPQSLPNRSGDSRNTSFSSRSPNVSHNLNQIREENKTSGSNAIIYFLGLVALLCAWLYYDSFGSTINMARYDELRFRNDLYELGALYKVGDDSILQLQAGISTIFEKEDTSCVVFLYNSKKNDYDASKFDGFVNKVVSNAAKFLRNDTTPSEHRVVDGADLNMNSHTQLVKAYQDDVAAAGVLLVKDVGLVPSPLAMAFHYYCDEYQPLVRKSAIFFTLNTARCHSPDEKSSHASAERCLKEKWDTVPKDNIGPLLTRVANIVVDVTRV